ncbi:MAG: Gfo/Idh/MocA family oxidoreductase [Kiritimatiellae bacterium]|nr:Gfo/Idh/MocA family oxidoreductase [Kiritimatiellia bacterium]
MKSYRVVVVGMGKRGMHHATTFKANPRFELAGICDIDQARLDAAAAKLGGPQTGTDAAKLAKAVKPDIFCFCTLPHLRLPFVRMGVESGARLIAFEKPVALTSREAMEMKRLLEGAGVKAVVSHQHRYGPHYRKVAEIAASGTLGRIQTVTATSTGWMTHMLSHLVDYARWYTGCPKALWAMAQAAGRGKLADNHPSPDYLAGVVQFEGNIRGYFEAGAGAPDQPEVAKWWGKNRISVQGTEGFAEVLTNGGWRAVTRRDGYQSGEGAMNYEADMPPYIQEMAEWLDSDAQPHACNFANAYAGFEIMAALQRSAATGGQIALPLTAPADEQELLRQALAERPVMVSAPVNAKEYGLTT